MMVILLTNLASLKDETLLDMKAPQHIQRSSIEVVTRLYHAESATINMIYTIDSNNRILIQPLITQNKLKNHGQERVGQRVQIATALMPRFYVVS
jgi:hypothetical protein